VGDILVKRGVVADGRIASVVVGLHRHPDRTIDRPTLLRWMRDGHSLVPIVNGTRLEALQLVEVGDGHVIRTDNEPIDEDHLPGQLTER
jgi:hypothetical protein